MLGTGQSRHNTHIGQTTVRQGDMLIDGSLRVRGDLKVDGELTVDSINVNSLTIGNPPYKLPPSAGQTGQIIKMNPDGSTTDWYDLPTPSGGGGSTTQIGSAELNVIVVGGGVTGQGLLPSFQGTRDLNINDFSVGGSYVIEAQGPIQYLYDGTTPSVVNSFRIKLNTILTGANNYNLEIDNFVDGTIADGTVQDSSYYSFWRYRAVITKTTTNQIHISTKAEMSKFNNPQDYRSFNQAPNIFAAQVINFTLDPTLTLSFTLQCDNLLGAGANCTFINPSIIWYVAQLGQVPPIVTTNDHLLLSNLDGGPAGDGGHNNMFLINGSKQMIGNINMNNNDILNVSDLRGIGTNNHINMNPSNQMDLSSGIISLFSTSSILHNTTSAHVFRLSSSDRLIISSSGLLVANGNLNLSNNNIINTSIISGPNGSLDFTGTETHLNSNNDLHLESASNFNTEVRIQGNGEFKVLHGGSDRFSVANNLITANRAISMDNNDINNIRTMTSLTAGTIDFGVNIPNQLQIRNNDMVIGDLSLSGNAVHIDSNRILIDGQVGNTEIKSLGADVKLTCNNLDLQGASSINNEKIIMNNTLAEHPLIVYLPALLSDFPNPVKNLLVTINSSGNIRPISTGDPDNIGVIGTTDEIVVADGLVRVQVGGICSFTPSPNQTITAGSPFERSNLGPALNGSIMLASGVGSCGIALTTATGAVDGSDKLLGLWTKNEHF